MKTIDNILHYMFLCHRLPERSFFIKGKQFPICARCTGILFGYLVGIIYLLLNREINYLLELSLFIPIALDGIAQYLGFWISTNRRRFITGLIAGIGTILLFRIAAIYGFKSGVNFTKLLFN